MKTKDIVKSPITWIIIIIIIGAGFYLFKHLSVYSTSTNYELQSKCSKDAELFTQTIKIFYL